MTHGRATGQNFLQDGRTSSDQRPNQNRSRNLTPIGANVPALRATRRRACSREFFGPSTQPEGTLRPFACLCARQCSRAAVSEYVAIFRGECRQSSPIRSPHPVRKCYELYNRRRYRRTRSFRGLDYALSLGCATLTHSVALVQNANRHIINVRATLTWV